MLSRLLHKSGYFCQGNALSRLFDHVHQLGQTAVALEGVEATGTEGALREHQGTLRGALRKQAQREH